MASPLEPTVWDVLVLAAALAPLVVGVIVLWLWLDRPLRERLARLLRRKRRARSARR